jgi:acetyl esterase
VAAYRWLAAEAIGLGIDPARIVIAGDSAGGHIAAPRPAVAEEAQPPPACNG